MCYKEASYITHTMVCNLMAAIKPYSHCQFLLSVALASSFATQAYACACCAEPGEHTYGAEQIDDYMYDELTQIQLQGPANLYVTACDLECVSGLEEPKYSYDITLDQTTRNWTFTFGTDGQKHGAFTFELPQNAMYFATDPAPNPNARSVVLYKEWRFNVTPVGTGIFAKSLDGNTTAQFILTGAGNYCTSVDTFTHWRFDVQNDDASFMFYGATTSK